MALAILRRLDGASRAALLVSAAATVAASVGIGALLDPATCASVPAFQIEGAVPLDLLLAVNPPAALAAGWIVMLGMMVPLLMVPSLGHLWVRTFARRRILLSALFCAGCVAAWALGAVAIETVALAGLSWLGWPTTLAIAIAAAVAWQVSPPKQMCLNACHRRPSLSAFGWPARLDALLFGFCSGVWCIGTCGPLMLAMILVPRGHAVAMVALALFSLAERLERPAAPAWRWRGIGRTVRLIRHHLPPGQSDPGRPPAPGARPTLSAPASGESAHLVRRPRFDVDALRG